MLDGCLKCRGNRIIHLIFPWKKLNLGEKDKSYYECLDCGQRMVRRGEKE